MEPDNEVEVAVSILRRDEDPIAVFPPDVFEDLESLTSEDSGLEPPDRGEILAVVSEMRAAPDDMERAAWLVSNSQALLSLRLSLDAGHDDELTAAALLARLDVRARAMLAAHAQDVSPASVWRSVSIASYDPGNRNLFFVLELRQDSCAVELWKQHLESAHRHAAAARKLAMGMLADDWRRDDTVGARRLRETAAEMTLIELSVARVHGWTLASRERHQRRDAIKLSADPNKRTQGAALAALVEYHGRVMGKGSELSGSGSTVGLAGF